MQSLPPPRYSFIVPLYNRPHELDELLASLVELSVQDFEVVVIEDGSSEELRAEHIAQQYSDRLRIQYHYKENTGPGLTRNYGMARANADWLIILDSDVILPPDYLTQVDAYLAAHPEVACYGGPDAAHANFSDHDKVVSFVFTSPITTGGIRGRKKLLGTYEPRSFNLGLHKSVFEATRGFAFTRQGEDIDFARRIRAAGFTIGFIENAVVFHKRRATWRRFWRQVFNFGQARWGLYKLHGHRIKPFHLLPTAFTLYVLGMLPTVGLLFFLFPKTAATGLGIAFVTPLAVYKLSVFVAALRHLGTLRLAVMAVRGAVTMHLAYGLGFLNFWGKTTFRGRTDYTL